MLTNVISFVVQLTKECMINIFIYSSITGLHTVLLLLWVLFHGVAAVKLIQHVHNTFPSCASIGVYHATTLPLSFLFAECRSFPYLTK